MTSVNCLYYDDDEHDNNDYYAILGHLDEDIVNSTKLGGL